MAPSYTPLSLGGPQIPQMNPLVGGQPLFFFGSNPSLNAPGWSNQSGRQATSYVPSILLSSSTLIPTNTFAMMNPPLSSGFTPEGGQFHTMENPQTRVPLSRGNVDNPHYNIPRGMVPNQPLMN
jgi:hypothetical protein